ncbi:MAG: D-serine ammonia-lyase [Firmicutes bacterium]|nr:D-serine ammonia-lyase [Bacillota bacterium]
MDINENTIAALKGAKECFWENPDPLPFREAEPSLTFHSGDIEDARARLERFAPLIKRLFPETKENGGLIESPLKEIPGMRKELGLEEGRLLLKMDSHLPIAGSVKARGGIYEVLKHTEDLALESGLLTAKSGPDEYAVLADKRDFFSGYKIQVGSTGNLGMSIGIMSAALGYKAIVHMSADAKDWKKKLLRTRGVTVVEYADDYSRAVEEGRRLSDEDPTSYFVDDESSSALYLGYSVAGKRLACQFKAMGIAVDGEHPLAVYIPCGVGGAPGGICFGLKEEFGDDVHVYFAEPVQAPCMLASLATGLGSGICVQDLGLTGRTDADGLAVGRASALVYSQIRTLLSGETTVDDARLYRYMAMLESAEHIVIEPSACASFNAFEAVKERLGQGFASGKAGNMTHVVWATGGSLMPPEIVREYLERGRK